MKQHFIIVGGGSAGAVLATRLSADAQRQVLLLEAGPNFRPDSYPTVLTDANVVAGSPTFDWQYHTEDAARLGHNIPVPRGRVIGGSSAVNAAVAMRARPADFARWAKRGIDGWSWNEVLAAYKALENTPTGDDAWHGRSGPFPIRQRTAEENTPSMRAFVEASVAIGLTRISDFNGATQHGVGPYPLNVVDGVRINTGMAYLTAAVRARSNLEPTVITGVGPGMPAFDEERFGPVAVITTFRNDEEAIALANATDYGLVAAVVSADLVRAQSVADGLHSGVVHINDQTVLHGVYGPIGGVGASGNGFGHGTVSNADQFSEWQWITTRSQIPAYPF